MKSGSPEIKELKERLVSELKKESILRSPLVEQAFRAIPREEFLWRGVPKFAAYFDEPQRLNETGQTMSAPHMVIMMLEALELRPGLATLEIGTGSGYNAALLAYIVSGGRTELQRSKAVVISIERDQRLTAFAKANLQRVGLQHLVQLVEGDGSLGYPQECTVPSYDRIVVTAAAPRIPNFLAKQLKPGGILLIPVGPLSYQKLLKLRKEKYSKEQVVGDANKGIVAANLEDGTCLVKEEIIDCMFVPLIGQDAQW